MSDERDGLDRERRGRHAHAEHPVSVFRLGEQSPPPPRRVNDTVVERFDHVYEVDPALMALTGQQELPAWDTRRIVDARWAHLYWMHSHFADEVLLAGEPSETMTEEE
jgi:hypothetical protein